MASSAEQIRAYSGPAILSYGFRPFFLFGALWSALAVALWLPFLSGHIVLPVFFQPVDWHVHELLFGYVPAIIAGFLLTAVPNWTGRLPVVGTPLLLLLVAWVAGRCAMLVSAWVGAGVSAAVDMLFLACLGVVIAREIIASGNTRNLKVLAVVLLMFAANALFHLQAIAGVGNGHGMRLGLAAIVMLIMLIGGRIIPSFSRNWLAQNASPKLPAPFDRFDVAVMAASGLMLACWVVLPEAWVTGVLAAMASVLNFGRLSRWAGERTWREPLVFILHVAFAFVPIGFGLVAAAIWRPDLIQSSGALHAWTAGAVGLMTLAVMTRASLGHTGRALHATRPIQFLYFAVFISTISRIAVAFGFMRDPLLYVAAVAWVLAFGGFVVVFAPLLTRRRA